MNNSCAFLYNFAQTAKKSVVLGEIVNGTFSCFSVEQGRPGFHVFLLHVRQLPVVFLGFRLDSRCFSMAWLVKNNA